MRNGEGTFDDPQPLHVEDVPTRLRRVQAEIHEVQVRLPHLLRVSFTVVEVRLEGGPQRLGVALLHHQRSE